MLDILASIATVFDHYKGFKVIFGGDFNFSFDHNSAGLSLLNEFVEM